MGEVSFLASQFATVANGKGDPWNRDGWGESDTANNKSKVKAIRIKM